MLVEEKELIDDQIRGLNRDSIKLWEDGLDKNYTINFVLEKPEWKKLYEKLTHEFEKEGEYLYVYPFGRLHMTLLGRVSRDISEEKISEVLKENMLGKKFGFKIGYLACNEMGVSIVCEPDFDLKALRDKVRGDLGINGDDYTKYLSIYEKLAWMNFIRFKKMPGDRFLETLWNMRNFQFGEYEAKDVSLYLNTSRTMDPVKCRLVEQIEF